MVASGSAAIVASRICPAALGSDAGCCISVAYDFNVLFYEHKLSCLLTEETRSFNVGYNKHGLPIGLQLIGRPWGEATILRLAAKYHRGETVIELWLIQEHGFKSDYTTSNDAKVTVTRTSGAIFKVLRNNNNNIKPAGATSGSLVIKMKKSSIIPPASEVDFTQVKYDFQQIQ
nr:fatty acid amide hydrolase [Tanacetum cinerariifolium]